ncbi:phosphotransferase family protein [Citricoccus sp. K5]|uniref:phosphotransferase family protein n=1 Tax=Citricoccus sp. K5 TaxID=2653135 RepID=UPI0012F0B659|nr:phosphotransferase family protein [Citricoccus sp. K5]VXA90456.1 Phosphotransferase [Citricoccus sp. K5]
MTPTDNRELVWDWTEQTLADLACFLEDRGVMSGPLRSKPIGDGHSNLTFLITNGEASVVVRRPPPPPLPPGANDMLREARFLSGLHGTGYPVPEVLATAQEGEVLDVPFYVMSFASGHVVTTSTPEALATPEQRLNIAHSLVDNLARLHQTDYRAAGLDDLGRPEGFNARHLKRMARLVQDAAGNLPADFDAVYDWLATNVPAESGEAVIHNDYRIGNTMISPDAPGRVIAILDWELATLGDPLFDLGYFLSSVPEPGHARTPTEDLGAAMLEEGYPGRAELAERYAEQTGADLTHLDWYVTLALWKLAALYEYSRRRGEDEYYLTPGLVDSFLAEARETAGLA